MSLVDQAAERELLGAFFALPSALDSHPTPADAWTCFPHEAIAAALAWLHDAAARISSDAVVSRLTQLGHLDAVGGAMTVHETALAYTHLRAIDALHDRVVGLAALRRQRAHLQRALAAVEREDAAEAMTCAAAALERGLDVGGAEIRTMQALALDSYHRATGPIDLSKRPLPTCVEGIDRDLVGSAPGDVILVVARTNVGKTSFALTMADALLSKGRRTGVIQVEDGPHLTGDRILSRYSKVPSRALRARDMNDDQHNRIAEAASAMSELTDAQGYVVACIPGATDAQVIRTASRMVRVLGCSLIVIDYIQACVCSTPEKDIRNALLVMGQRFKAMAGRLGCVVLITSQATTETGGENTPPKLSDVRDCKVLESQCDTGLVLWESGDLVLGCVGKTKAEGKGNRFAFRRGHGGALIECDVPEESTGGYQRKARP